MKKKLATVVLVVMIAFATTAIPTAAHAQETLYENRTVTAWFPVPDFLLSIFGWRADATTTEDDDDCLIFDLVGPTFSPLTNDL